MTFRTGRRAAPAALALSLLLGGCITSSTDPSRRQISLPDPPSQQPQHTASTTTPTQREHQRILSAYSGAYTDQRLDAMLVQTVDKLVAASERPDQRYRITVLNSPAVNAFALPTGHLYVTRGLISLANDSSELASVLSHEMAHVIAQHALLREDRAKQVSLVSRVFDNFGSDPDMNALALAKSKIALATFSRSQEFEADGIGVGIAARAGYDPFGAVRFLSSLGRQAELRPPPAQGGADQRMPDFLSSHPATPERVRNAQINARQFSGPSNTGRDRSAYLAAIDGMIYGEDPSEGYVRGRRFLHPKFGFTFMAPDGFTLDNTAQAVLGLRDGGSQALRLDLVRLDAGQTLPQYLRSGWIENIDPTSIEEVAINGMQAATAVSKGDQWTFRLFVVRFGSDVYRFIFATKQMTPEIDHGFKDSVASFRRMTSAEINTARPLRIRMVRVGESDTVERLASKMATDRQVERFRILNGLAPSDRVRAGEQVKIVTE